MDHTPDNTNEKLFFLVEQDDGKITINWDELKKGLYDPQKMKFLEENLGMHILKLKRKLETVQNEVREGEKDIDAFDCGDGNFCYIINSEELQNKSSSEKDERYHRQLHNQKLLKELKETIKNREKQFDRLKELNKKHSEPGIMRISRQPDRGISTSVLKLPPLGVKARFVYEGETANGKKVPVADSNILFWRYNRSDKKVDLSKPDSRFVAVFDICRTDSEGYIYSVSSESYKSRKNSAREFTYRDTDDETPFCAATLYKYDDFEEGETEYLEIRTFEHCREEAEQALKKNPLEEFKGKRIQKTLSSFSPEHDNLVWSHMGERDPFFRKKSGTKNDKWYSTDTNSEFFDPNSTYGFMILPDDMGSCSIKNLSELGGKKFDINGEKKVVAVKTKPPRDGSPIELHCTLREWDRRIQMKNEELMSYMKAFKNLSSEHSINLSRLEGVSQFVELLTQYPYHSNHHSTDEYKPMDSATDPWHRPSITQHRIHVLIRAENRLIQLKKDLAGFEAKLKQPERAASHARYRERIDEIEKNIIQTEKRCDDLVRDFETEMKEPSKTGKTHENKLKLLNSLDELKSGVTEHINKPSYYTRDSAKRVRIKAFRDKIDELANELWSMVRSKAFQDEFKAFLQQQKHTKEKDTFYDGHFSEPCCYMNQEYYVTTIYDTLNHAYVLLQNTKIKDELWKTEIEPGLTALANREEFKEFNGILATEIQERIKELRKTEGKTREQIESDKKNADRLAAMSEELKEKVLQSDQKSDSLLVTIWNAFEYSEGFLRNVVVSSPGPDCLLQASLNIFEDIACSAINKNFKHFDRFTKVFTFLVQTARFSEVSKEVIAKSISRSLANSVNLSNTNRLMKDHFLARDVYMDGKTPLAPSQSQLTRVVALKSALMILTIQSLHEKWLEVDKIVNSNQPVQNYYDWVKSVCCIFQAAGETATAGAVAYMIGAKMGSLVVGKPVGMQWVSGWANRLGFILSAISTVYAGTETIEAIYDRKSGEETARKIIAAISASMAMTGMIVSSTFVQTHITGCLFFPGIGPWLFVGSIALAFAGNEMLDLYEKYWKEKALVSFDNHWKAFQNSPGYSKYEDTSLEWSFRTRNAIWHVNNNRKKTDFGRKLSWHAIIPLKNLGYTAEQVKEFIQFVRIEASLYSSPLGGTSNEQLLFEMPKRIVEDLFKFYDELKKKGNAPIGIKTCREVAGELATGTCIPKGLRGSDFFMYDYLEHPFYKVKADIAGTLERSRFAVLIHEQMKENPNTRLRLEMLYPQTES